MPKLIDDPRYKAALSAQIRLHDEQLAAFRRRLSSRMVGLIGAAVSEMGDHFDEALLRRAMAEYDQIYVDESMAYIRSMLIQSGRIELAKRMIEVGDQVDMADLPEAFQAAYRELEATGAMSFMPRLPVPDDIG